MGDASILYSSQVPVLCSALSEKKLGLTLEWDPWKLRVIEISPNGILSVWKVENIGKKTLKYEFDVNKVLLTYLRNNLTHSDQSDHSHQHTEAGLHINLKTKLGHDTQLRLILKESEIAHLYDALRVVSKEHNLDNVRQGSITEQVKILANEKHLIRHVSSEGGTSIMRRSIARAMDTYNTHSQKHRILRKRGTMRWLPVYMANDLVHGAWWFVWGSALFVISSVLVFANACHNHDLLGEDDSLLSPQSYRASWLLMVISAVFCTLGSLAFVRAVHDEPPMPPLFSWYHIHSDELLGSWLFLLAAVPIIPYTLIYLAQSHGQVIYYVALAVAALIVLGCLLFVRACYPSEDQTRRELIQPIARFCCTCCCSSVWLDKHFINDWLAGTWFILWGTLLAFFVCLILLMVALAERDVLSIFIMLTGLIENWCFLVGSAYFVAGSYPEDTFDDAGAASGESGENGDPEGGLLSGIDGTSVGSSQKVRDRETHINTVWNSLFGIPGTNTQKATGSDLKEPLIVNKDDQQF
eukprot:gene25364-30626_t